MVGGQGGEGRIPAGLSGTGRSGAGLGGTGRSGEMRAAYAAAAGGWAAGPGQVYGPLARALVGAAQVPVAGRRVLDLGAGSGVAGQAALAAGAEQVVATDLAEAMLRMIGPAQHPVAADAVALPFRDGAFDLVLAAFCLNHLGRPGGALREIRRVGRGLAASTFAPGWAHPAKAAVDEALRPFGFRPPAWYESMKQEGGPAAQNPAWLGGQAAAAGWTRVRVRTIAVPTGLSTPAQLASWRLGLASVAPFLRSLEPARRAAARRAAEQAVAGTGPLVVSMLVLTAG